jgi:para-nitrobenzyl esterase
MLDIVAALHWVRDDIGSFGGDANLVTIFGQSGGGAKVGTLMAMPSAQGLFHRAIVESGSMLRAVDQEKSRELAEAIVGELGLTAATIDQIQSLPYRQILDAGEKVLRARNPTRPGAALNLRHLAASARFGPVVDGKVLPAHPFDPVAPALSADVPMIIGTTLNEFVTAIDHPEYELMGQAQLEKQVAEVYGEHAPQVLAAFRERTPHAKPFDLWSRIAVAPFRFNAIKQAQAKAAQGKAPAYLYWFTWQTPILSGRPRAFHCSEIAFVFDNAERCDSMTGGGPAARSLAANMSDAWLRFARTGDPNHPNLPHWPSVTTAHVPTMIFDHPPQMLVDPDAAEQHSIAVD